MTHPKDEALKAAYLAGFNASGEGYNGEYGVVFPETDAVWCKDRDNAITAIKQARSAPVQEPVDSASKDAIMASAYDFRDAHISGSMNLKRSAHAALECAVDAALTTRSKAASVQGEPFTYYRNYDGGTQDWPDEKTIPLYTTPPAAQPSVPLTVDQIYEIADSWAPDLEKGALCRVVREVEAAHGITKGNTL